MHAVIYGIVGDDDNGNLAIEGPYFHTYSNDFNEAETLAKELANSKTKNQIIPWVFNMEKKETISEMMIRVSNGWFQKFRNRTLQTYKTIQKDQNNSSCPFVDVNIERFVEYINQL